MDSLAAPLAFRKFHAAPVTVMAAGDGDAEIEAVLSETGTVDLDFDKILPGAFDEAIRAKQTPIMLYMHARGAVIGQWSELRMDGAKLVAKGLLATGEQPSPRAQDAMALVHRGYITGVSISFRPTKWSIVREKDRPYGWDIEKLNLIEASLVDCPANQAAHITEVKRKLAGDGGDFFPFAVDLARTAFNLARN